jgi:hypothetical protein
MFTPEFSSDDKGEYVLVANHSLQSADAIELSIQYNKARIAFGTANLPSHIQKCRLIYDIRGQSVSEAVVGKVTEALKSICTLEFMS